MLPNTLAFNFPNCGIVHFNTFPVKPGNLNASTGILAAALYDPVFVTAVTGPATFALALVCFVLLVAFRLPPWMVVLVGAAGGIVVAIS